MGNATLIILSWIEQEACSALLANLSLKFSIQGKNNQIVKTSKISLNISKITDKIWWK